MCVLGQPRDWSWAGRGELRQCEGDGEGPFERSTAVPPAREAHIKDFRRVDPDHLAAARSRIEELVRGTREEWRVCTPRSP